MKEHPILYSTKMIQAKLAGRKTQTRRIIKVQPEEQLHPCGSSKWYWSTNPSDLKIPYVKCPYGQIGDLIWARETFRKYCLVDEHGYTHFDQEIIEFAADNLPMIRLVDGDGRGMENKDGTEKYVPWKPSIHMPKSAARIWDRITDIRVERLQDITETDARAEGIEKHWYDDHLESPGCDLYFVTGVTKEGFGYPSAIEAYKNLWESINGPGSWELNPWVWVITSEILSTAGRPAGLAVSKTETV